MQPWSQPLLWGGVIHDPYWSDVVLLMGFNGANGSTGAPGMTDESPHLHGNATVNGTAQISTTQEKFGPSSLGLSNNFGIRYANSADWALTNQPFTIECWIYPNSVSGNQFLIAHWNGSTFINSWAFWLSGNSLSWNVSTDGSNNLGDMAWAGVSTGGWHHVAIDFDGTKYRMYYDGVTKATFSTVRNIFTTSDLLGIGCDANGNFPFNGYIDELRVTKGVARYATDTSFIVPAAAFPRS